MAAEHDNATVQQGEENDWRTAAITPTGSRQRSTGLTGVTPSSAASPPARSGWPRRRPRWPSAPSNSWSCDWGGAGGARQPQGLFRAVLQGAPASRSSRRAGDGEGRRPRSRPARSTLACPRSSAGSPLTRACSRVCSIFPLQCRHRHQGHDRRWRGRIRGRIQLSDWEGHRLQHWHAWCYKHPRTVQFWDVKGKPGHRAMQLIGPATWRSRGGGRRAR